MAAPARQLSRHITADGRNSIRAHLFGNRSKPMTQVWSKSILKTETYPLIGAVGGAMLLAGWFGVRHLTTSPDVRINKVQRKSTIRHNDKEGANWIKHRASMVNAAQVVRKVD